MIAERYAGHLGLVWHMVHRLAWQSEDMEEVFSVAALGFVRATRGYDPARGGSFANLACTSMRHEVLRWRRDRLAAKRSAAVVSLDDYRVDSDGKQVHLRDRLAAPGDAYADLIRRLDVERALAQLTAAERDLLHLRYWRRLSQPEIARRGGVSQKTISVRERDALAKLRRLLI